jgi:ribokinase
VRITVLGSLVMDLVVEVPRMPVPGEALTAGRLAIVPGGKGANQAIAAARLGADIAMIGTVGDDPFGQQLLALLDSEGIDRAHVRMAPDVPTGVAMPMVLPDGQNSIIVAPSANFAVTVAEIERAASAIAGADMLLLQHEVPDEANLAAARIAASAGVPVLLNPAPARPIGPDLLACVDVLVPNEVEAAMLCGDGPQGPAAQARALYRDPMRAVVVTLGEAGAASFDGSIEAAHPAFAVRAIDTVGAGDAFIGAFAIALCDGVDLATAIRFASAAGALATLRRGASPAMPWRTDLEAFLTNGRVLPSHDVG